MVIILLIKTEGSGGKMIDALFDFVVLIKDHVMSMIDGFSTLFNSFTTILGLSAGVSVWMPSFLVQFLNLFVPIVIGLRIIGR